MTKTAPYRVPAPETLDSDLADLEARRSAMQIESAANLTEIRTLEKAIAADKSPEVRPGVAALLGDPVSGKAGMRARLAELYARQRDLDAAQHAMHGRLRDARSKASIAVTDHARPEYRKRVGAIVDALRALKEARESYHELIDQFEANDVTWTRLVPVSLGWMGDRKDGHIDRFIRDAKEAGHVD